MCERIVKGNLNNLQQWFGECKTKKMCEKFIECVPYKFEFIFNDLKVLKVSKDVAKIDAKDVWK